MPPAGPCLGAVTSAGECTVAYRARPGLPPEPLVTQLWTAPPADGRREEGLSCRSFLAPERGQALDGSIVAHTLLSSVSEDMKVFGPLPQAFCFPASVEKAVTLIFTETSGFSCRRVSDDTWEMLPCCRGWCAGWLPLRCPALGCPSSAIPAQTAPVAPGGPTPVIRQQASPSPMPALHSAVPGALTLSAQPARHLYRVDTPKASAHLYGGLGDGGHSEFHGLSTTEGRL